jgi:hypothetical protein
MLSKNLHFIFYSGHEHNYKAVLANRTVTRTRKELKHEKE